MTQGESGRSASDTSLAPAPAFVQRKVEPSRHLYAGHEYVPASHTDIRARFKAIEQERQRAAFENVTQMRRKP
jgi:hypothetical protein